MVKVVITDHRFPDVEQERRAAEAVGGQLVVGHLTDEAQLIDFCRDADAVLNGRAKITAKVIAAMEHCRIIVRYGIGIDTIDIPAATERGIMVANVPDYCVDEVSDHALTLLLMLSRQAIPSMAIARQDTWSLGSLRPLHRLRGQVCGLFGAGRIGSLLASKLAPLGMQIIVHDPYLSESQARAMGAELVSFDDLLARSDFISLHAPLTDETHHRFGESAFTRMKPEAFLINCARGGLVDEGALITALDAGKIAGAGLDAVESESVVTPMRTALVNHPKIVVTAHTAWLSVEARRTLQARAAAQVAAALRGEKPYGLVNRPVAK